MTSSSPLDPALDVHLTPTERAAMRQDVASAVTFPAASYVDPTVWRLELDRVIATTWAAVAFENQVAAPGDVHPMVFGEWPLVLTRTGDGSLHVLHNVCPRDGCPAVLDAANVGRIVGPYHGWEWDLAGRLERATLFDGTTDDDPAAFAVSGFDADLVPVRHSVWQGIVFVNVSGDAPDFETHIAPASELHADVDLAALRAPVAPDGEMVIDRFVFDANWKTVYENFAINVNHESFVHDVYAASDQIPRVVNGVRTYEEIDDRGYQGLRFSAESVARTYPEAPELPGLRLADGRPLANHTIMTLFPNLNLSVFPDHLCATILNPVAPDRTGYDSTVRFTDAMLDLVGPGDGAAIAAGYLAEWGSARDEDARVCAAIQAARRSPAFSAHRYVPFWDRMHHSFNLRVLDAMEHAR